MKESKKKRKRDPLPEEFGSLEEAGEFWDTHDSTDYEDLMTEVHFEVDLRRRVHEVRIPDQLLSELRKAARRRGVATETLVNLWLQERVSADTKPA